MKQNRSVGEILLPRTRNRLRPMAPEIRFAFSTYLDMTPIAIQRLDGALRATVLAHFLALPLTDRRLRFGTALAESAIAGYVDRIDFHRDAVFGVHDDRRALVGLAHVAVEGDLAEVGLSVLPPHRRRGAAIALFERAMMHARGRRISRLVMQFLWSNTPIMRIAQRFRMRIVANAGDANARLDLLPASVTSRASAFAADTLPPYMTHQP